MTQVSYLAIFTAIFWIALIILIFALGGDLAFVLMAGAMLAILIALPFAMSAMNRSTFHKVAEEYGPSAVEIPISSIDQTFSGKVVRVRGTVSGIGRLWLAKPRYTISDGKRDIEATAMFMPKASLRKDDEVEVLGVINQGLEGKGKLTISVLSIEKS
jgi:hypothetical protein